MIIRKISHVKHIISGTLLPKIVKFRITYIRPLNKIVRFYSTGLYYNTGTIIRHHTNPIRPLFECIRIRTTGSSYNTGTIILTFIRPLLNCIRNSITEQTEQNHRVYSLKPQSHSKDYSILFYTFFLSNSLKPKAHPPPF